MVEIENVRSSYKKSENARKHAKNLFMHGLSIVVIAEILELDIELVDQWMKEKDFLALKSVAHLRIQHMQRLLLESFETLKKGGKPKISPAQLLQYATAYEKLSDKKKQLGAMFDAFDLLTNVMITEATTMKTFHKKRRTLHKIQEVRQSMWKVLSAKMEETFHD